MIILYKHILLQFILDGIDEMELTFSCQDDGDVYSMLTTDRNIHHGGVEERGMIYLYSDLFSSCVKKAKTKKACVLVYVEKYQESSEHTKGCQYICSDDCSYRITAYRLNKNQFEEDSVIIVPEKKEIFSRIDGLFETAALSEKSVAVIGLGSGGSYIALELIKSGVQNFFLVDDDRLEVGNVVRHVCGISDLGRYKTKAVRDLMLDKNPYAEIKTIESAVNWETYEIVSQMIESVDLVICATDNRESKMIINEICIKKNKVCLYGGAFRRAYGGQVLRVVPRKTICFQCFLDALPEIAADTEISNLRQVQNIQYSDVIVPIEPGLSSDISPISLLITKLAILELIKNQKHTLNSLYEDFKGAWYIWLNRREVDTIYEQLEPLEYNVDGMHIMRWYSIDIDRYKECPICGDFLTKDTITQDDLNFFA